MLLFFFIMSFCRCSKLHPACEESTTLLVPNMFASLGFMEMMLDERDSDAALEVHKLTTHIVSLCVGQGIRSLDPGFVSVVET